MAPCQVTTRMNTFKLGNPDKILICHYSRGSGDNPNYDHFWKVFGCIWNSSIQIKRMASIVNSHYLFFQGSPFLFMVILVNPGAKMQTHTTLQGTITYPTKREINFTHSLGGDMWSFPGGYIIYIVFQRCLTINLHPFFEKKVHVWLTLNDSPTFKRPPQKKIRIPDTSSKFALENKPNPKGKGESLPVPSIFWCFYLLLVSGRGTLSEN